MRVAEAGPWWELAESRNASSADSGEVAKAESVLGEVGGLRVLLQKQARDQLTEEGKPVNRSTVALRALSLLSGTNGSVAV